MRLLNSRKHFIALFIFFFCLKGLSQNSVKELHQKASEEFRNGNYGEALNCDIKALKIIENSNDAGAIANGNIQIGRMYYFLHNKRLALNYFFKSREIINKHSIDSLSYAVNYNIGVMYTEMALGDSALLFYNYARIALEKNPDYKNLSKLHGVIADLHLNNTHNYELAKVHIKAAEKYAEMANSNTWKAFAYIKYSIYYKFMKDFPQSLKYARMANSIYEANGELDGRMYSLKVLADALALNKDPGAKETYEKLLNLKDSVFGIETANKIANYKTLYESEKKESENNLLIQENNLSQTKIEAKNKTIIGLLIGVVLIIISVFWRISVINLKKKHQELEASQAIHKEKERISRDLHDNVGGQLSYVLYSLDGLNDESKEKRIELTENLNESIRNVIGNLRETIWAINDESIAISDFCDKLKVYARTMFRNSTTTISFKENIINERRLNSLVGLNLFRICQEIINNAFKHSEASELKIDITSNEKIRLTISDNGKGFDSGILNNEGFGLNNLKSRAREVGISIELISEQDKGTTYTLIV